MNPAIMQKPKWQDHYTRKAKAEKYPARSVYKLQEIQKKFRIIAKGARVLDLGCAPGSWLIYAAQLCGPGGKAIGIDLKPVSGALPAWAKALQADLLDDDDRAWQQAAGTGRFDVVLSDMAPSTSGNKHVDAARSYQLCCQALQLARDLSGNGAHFVCKIFQGDAFMQFNQEIKQVYKQCKNFKPQSSRKASREMYLIGLNKK